MKLIAYLISTICLLWGLLLTPTYSRDIIDPQLLQRNGMVQKSVGLMNSLGALNYDKGITLFTKESVALNKINLKAWKWVIATSGHYITPIKFTLTNHETAPTAKVHCLFQYGTKHWTEVGFHKNLYIIKTFKLTFEPDSFKIKDIAFLPGTGL